MKKADKKVELLAPAGNFEKLEIAVHYGADAVYLAGKEFGLRSFSGNFTLDEMQRGISLAHKNGVRVYVACNIFARNFDQKAIIDYLLSVGEIGPDAVIIADPGVFLSAKDVIPQIPVHLSTQANTTNINSVIFWERLGVKRINIARELSLKEIKEICLNCKAEIEAFVHGAMCISYSGRCLLSSFMTNRDSNRGLCSHSCRWNYYLLEEQRPMEYMQVLEDDRGSYILNSKDLCMIEHIPEMIDSGISSLKIEGRMKGINYLASAVKVYREAIDTYYKNPENYRAKTEWIIELSSINYRGYCTGFYISDPDHSSFNYSNTKPSEEKLFAGKVIKSGANNNIFIEVRNKIFKGDNIEIISRKGPAKQDRINNILDENGRSIPFAQPGSRVTIELETICNKNDLIRKIIAGP